MEGLVFKPWREKLWAKVKGHHILEVGAGTGKNFDYYPKDARITAIDFSPAMLKQAEQAKLREKHRSGSRLPGCSVSRIRGQ